MWKHIGEGVVKELDFSRVWLRLNEADEGDKDDVITEWKGDTEAFFDKTLVRCINLCMVSTCPDRLLNCLLKGLP